MLRRPRRRRPSPTTRPPLGDRLSEALLQGQFGPGDKVVVDCVDDELTLKYVPLPALT